MDMQSAAKVFEQVWAWVNSDWPPLVKAAVIAVGAWLSLFLLDRLTRGFAAGITPLAERSTPRGKQRTDTLSSVFRYASTVIIVFAAGATIFDTLDINLKAFIATVGFAGLAVGFGAQSLVKDVVTGMFILIEDQFAVGDVVEINGVGGRVEQLNLRITQLRGPEGALVTIPNGQITMVKNMSSEWARVDYQLGVAYGADIERTQAVLMEEARGLQRDLPNDIIEGPELLGVDALGNSSVTLRLWFKTAPLQQWKVRREFNRRVLERFTREGIEIPFPQMAIWMRSANEKS